MPESHAVMERFASLMDPGLDVLAPLAALIPAFSVYVVLTVTHIKVTVS